MKTIEEIKNDIAVKHGYKSWKDVSTYAKSLLVDEVATEYAKQMCDLQIEACAKEATCSIDWVDFHDFSLGINGAHVDDYSILETPNVVTTNTK